MNNKHLILIICVLFFGCAHTSGPSHEDKAQVQPTQVKPMGSTRLLIHLIRPESLALLLSRVGEKSEEKFVVNTILSQLDVSPGKWQLQGLVIEGVVFRFKNPDQRPVFNVQKNKVSYIGSYLFQCPKVLDSHRRSLKVMSYFNRYKVNASSKLCEVIIGSDFDQIKKIWKKIGDKQLPLAVAF